MPFWVRHNFTGIIFLIYLLPLLVVTSLSSHLFSDKRSLGLFSLGLLISAAGTLLLLWLLDRKEQSSVSEEKETVQQTTVEQEALPSEIVDDQLQALLQEKQAQIESLKVEKEKLLHHIDSLVQEFQQYKESREKELAHQKSLMRETEEALSEQRMLITRKQQQIAEFESKVHDLNYEVKTLLKLADLGNKQDQAPSNPKQEIHLPPKAAPVSSPSDESAKEQLKKCVDIAQKITGASPFGGGGLRFRELNIDNYALDLRRLYDALKDETQSPIVVWSQRENKLLFANHQIKNMLGWGPEQFVQEFRSILNMSLHDWQDGIGNLQVQRETEIHLQLKTKSGQLLPVVCHLRIIPSGIFRSHAIGILQESRAALKTY